MAAGVPVVAFDQVARSLAVKDGQEILLAPNTSALIQQVLRLLNDYNLRLDVSRCARIFIENNFTWELACAKLEGVYKRMLYK
jgi:glycosyltransferase involved in cell wall biosynthesis